jgi:phosphohistidine phosphatase SixA
VNRKWLLPLQQNDAMEQRFSIGNGHTWKSLLQGKAMLHKVLLVTICLLGILCQIPASAQSNSEATRNSNSLGNLINCKKIIIIRHAEKAADVKHDNNPVLLVEGTNRAIALVTKLKDEHVTKIFVSEMIRTQATAKPLLTFLGTNCNFYSTNLLYANGTQAFQYLKAHVEVNDVVLVVYHSDEGAIPALIRHLGGPNVTINNFHEMFVFTPDNSRKKLKMHRDFYGDPSR